MYNHRGHACTYIIAQTRTRIHGLNTNVLTASTRQLPSDNSPINQINMKTYEHERNYRRKKPVGEEGEGRGRGTNLPNPSIPSGTISKSSEPNTYYLLFKRIFCPRGLVLF